MERMLPICRRIARPLGPVLGLLLLAMVAVGSTHHHGVLDAHHGCVVCTASGAPAIAADPAPAIEALARSRQRETALPFETPARREIADCASRAPPSA